MRVMTWNLWWRFGPWEERLPAIVETVRRLDPDIALLQEVWIDEAADGSSATARRPMWKLSVSSGLSAYRSMRPNTSAASPRSSLVNRFTRASSKTSRSYRAWNVPPSVPSWMSRSFHASFRL